MSTTICSLEACATKTSPQFLEIVMVVVNIYHLPFIKASQIFANESNTKNPKNITQVEAVNY